jgi:ribA/ribD-fused uncharacterized protein
MEYLFFFGQNNENGYLSNFYLSNFKDDKPSDLPSLIGNKNEYFCNEQYMMYQKAILFKDLKIAELIMKQNNPIECKKLGRKVKNFDNDIWNKNAKDIVCKGLFLKFSQNIKLKNFLLNTKDKILAEASPYDKIWGIGISVNDAKNGKAFNGTNWLGECLMKVRDELK